MLVRKGTGRAKSWGNGVEKISSNPLKMLVGKIGLLDRLMVVRIRHFTVCCFSEDVFWEYSFL